MPSPALSFHSNAPGGSCAPIVVKSYFPHTSVSTNPPIIQPLLPNSWYLQSTGCWHTSYLLIASISSKCSSGTVFLGSPASSDREPIVTLTRDDGDGRTDPVGVDGMLVEVIACVFYVVGGGGSFWIYASAPRFRRKPAMRRATVCAAVADHERRLPLQLLDLPIPT